MRLFQLSKQLGVATLLLVAALPSYAEAPVIDIAAVTNLIKNYNQLKTQYSLLRDTYQNAQQQLDRAKALVNDNEGHYGYGGLLDSATDFNNQQWSPATWDQTLKGLSGGNPVRYQELVSLYKKEHPTLTTSDYQQGATQAKAAVYQQDVTVNRAAVVNATYAFDNLNDHLKRIHTLTQKIDAADNTKAAMDLNTRLVAEVAYIQAEELKMQVLFNQQMAQANADRIASKTASAQFNTLPKD